MRFIRNIRIKKKLYIAILAPLAGLLSYAALAVYSKYQWSDELASLEKLSRVAVEIGDLVDETQKESSLSVVVLGDREGTYLEELLKQREATNTKADRLASLLKSLDLLSLRNELGVTLAAAVEKLDRLPKLRDGVDRFAISVQEAVSAYSGLNTSFFTTLEYMKKLSTNAEVSNFLSAYLSFLRAKDSTAVLRGVLRSILKNRRISAEEIKLFSMSRAAAEVHFQIFTASATLDLKNAFKEAMKGHFTEEAARIEQKVSEAGSETSLNEDPDAWFMVMGEKLKILKQFENRLAQSLSELTKQLQQEARREVVTTALLSLLLTLVSLLLALFLSRLILRPLAELTQATEKLISGDKDIAVAYNSSDELGDLSRAFNSMVSSLRSASIATEKERWLKSAQAGLADVMRGEPSIETLARDIITYLSQYVKAKVGVIYVADVNNELKVMGGYAFSRRKNIENSIKPGEGLVGQAALEKAPIILTDVPEGYLPVVSGLGETSSQNVIVVPAVYENRVMAVFELGALFPFTDEHLALFSTVAENIAIALGAAQDRDHRNVLLEQTRHQAEQLQIQQEELRATNEELEEHTKVLRESQERLKEQSEELKAINDELGEKADLLTYQKNEIEQSSKAIEAARQELEHKADELERASKYKSEFLANMSHELRTPLNSLLILSKSLADNEDGNLNPDQIEAAKIIHSGGVDLLSLINDILDLSKVEAGKMDIQIEEVKIEEILKTIQTQFKHVAQHKGIEFKIKTTNKVPGKIHTDSQRLGQILKNLLSNAFKFTSEGSVTLKVYVPGNEANFRRAELVAGKTLAFSVSDTGIGIPEDKRDLIFEAFQQADGSTTRKYGGTGLGLSISKQLSFLLGGEIHLEPRDGGGSVFTVFLPLEQTIPIDVPKKESKQAAKSTMGNATNGSSHAVNAQEGTYLNGEDSEESLQVFIPDDREKTALGDKSILVVEDDARFAKILFDLSRKKGYKVLVAGDGRSAIRLARKYRPVAILLDLGLPDISGVSVMECLKTDPKTKDIPIHVVSGGENVEDMPKSGAVGFLKKPVTLEAIDEVFTKIEILAKGNIKQLLLVEDDERSQKAISHLLRNKQVQLTAAATGEQAFNLLTSKKFDCVILDLNLPDMSGFGLLKKVRATPETSNPPVIIHTGRELTLEENEELLEYAQSVVIKGLMSHERLLDETTLFLHSVSGNSPAVSKPEQDSGNGKKRKVLLVDDDKRNLFALSKSLEQNGLSIITAENGQIAIDTLKQDSEIQLVLMDIMMPVMDGYEAIRAIRKDQGFEELPIIALTAKAMREDRAKCLQAGANDYMMKPVNMEQLLTMVSVWLYR